MQPPIVDVIVPGAWSSKGLEVTLASLARQRYPAFRVSVARPSGEPDGPAVAGIVATLEARGHGVRFPEMPPVATAGLRGHALFRQAGAPYVLVVDDGIYLEPDLLGRLVAAIRATGCGMVGSAAIDLRYRNEHPADEQDIEFWDGPVRPEDVHVGTRAWARRAIHRGANLEHLRERLPRTRDRLYRIADIHGCVLYDRATLQVTGGFAKAGDGQLEEPISLEAAAQLRVLEQAGGAGLFPSGAYLVVAGTPMSTSGGRALELGEIRPGTSARWIRRVRTWRPGLANGLRRVPARLQIRAPGPPRLRSTLRPAEGPHGS